MTQTRIDDTVEEDFNGVAPPKYDKLMPADGQTPKQNNYEMILKWQADIANELLWLRHEWEDNKRDLFDLNVLVGRLATKIEIWVGVAEE